MHRGGPDLTPLDIQASLPPAPRYPGDIRSDIQHSRPISRARTDADDAWCDSGLDVAIGTLYRSHREAGPKKGGPGGLVRRYITERRV